MTRDKSLKKVEREQDIPPVSHSIAHYLVCIHQLLDTSGYARNIDVAKHMGRTRGTVSVILKRMVQEDLLSFDENNFIKLTEKGHEITHRVLGSKIAVSKFLHEVLGVSEEVSVRDACKIEHHLSRETVQHLVDYLNSIGTDSSSPSGGPMNFVRQMHSSPSICPNASQCHVCHGECLLNFDAKLMHSV